MSENIVKENLEENFAEASAEICKIPQRFEICKKDIIFSLLLLLSSAIFSFMGLWGGFRAGFTFSSLLSIGLITAYLCKKESRMTFFTVLCLVFSVLLSVIFSITSNSSVRFFGFCVLMLVELLWFVSLVKPCEKSDYGLLAMIFAPVFRGALPNFTMTIVSLFSGENKHRKTIGSAVFGVVLALPVLLVVVPLLISSDAAFSGFAMKLIGDIAGSVFKLITAVIITPFIISYCFSLAKEEQKAATKPEFKKAENVVIISFLSVLALCYLAYLFSQLAYFFSAFSGFLPEDYSFTISAYARRGFFEMCVIAAINFVIIFVCLMLSGRKEGKICAATKILCTFIGFFTLVIIATALSKMFLYINSFGMTELRITTTAFMIFLSVTFISLMFKVFIAKIRVLRVALISAATVLTVLGMLNINSIIASYNYNAYINGDLKSIDINEIYQLGDEGIPYLVMLTVDDDITVSDIAKQRLTYAYTDGEYYECFYEEDGSYSIGEKLYSDLGQFSFSRHKAYKALDEYLLHNPEILCQDTLLY